MLLSRLGAENLKVEKEKGRQQKIGTFFVKYVGTKMCLEK